jgi:uncharacterized protein YukE
MAAGGGYGVDPSQIQKVSSSYKTEGDTIVGLRSESQTSIGASQVGQKYAGTAAPYQQVFQQFGQILSNLGNKIIETGGSLSSVADSYAQTESGNARNLGGA